MLLAAPNSEGSVRYPKVASVRGNIRIEANYVGIPRIVMIIGCLRCSMREKMAVACSLCNGKKFINQAAYQQHCEMSPKHRQTPVQTQQQSLQTCNICPARFTTQGTLTEHYQTLHFRCELCQVYVASLQSHWDASTSHPKCPICRSGFQDKRSCGLV
ncbi:hypothetical protein BXZ70DRAFT_77275 [Cristinia sonorae]|uniref:C2H2-type domain-containing protein n=1 Tax=Cristinia sonorae TaxID=1940300 RepID=A0A8K0XR43_9AGAR|nr:hypothetical protein BXZ70DRAFT_77275 [Cristinia sonorae]